MGFNFFVLVLSYTDVAISNLPIIVGVSIFSGVMGLIAIFASAGIGVREGLIVLLLSIFPLSGHWLQIAGCLCVWSDIFFNKAKSQDL